MPQSHSLVAVAEAFHNRSDRNRRDAVQNLSTWGAYYGDFSADNFAAYYGFTPFIMWWPEGYYVRVLSSYTSPVRRSIVNFISAFSASAGECLAEPLTLCGRPWTGEWAYPMSPEFTVPEHTRTRPVSLRLVPVDSFDALLNAWRGTTPWGSPEPSTPRRDPGVSKSPPRGTRTLEPIKLP